MKRYRMYVKINDYYKDRYSHYMDSADCQQLIEVAKGIFALCVVYDTFTGKIIWSSREV